MKFLVTLLLVVSLSGCAAYQAVTKSPVIEAAVRTSVGRVLENNPSWVGPAYRYTAMAISTIKGNEIVDVDVLDSLFVSMIDDQLLPEERDIAVMLFEDIKTGVIADMERRGITDPSEQAMYALQVLSWINQSASFRL